MEIIAGRNYHKKSMHLALCPLVSIVLYDLIAS